MKKLYTNYLLSLFISLYLLFGCSSANSSLNISDEKQKIETTIRNSIAWAKNKDLTTLYNSLDKSEDYLEVDPNGEIIRGISQFRKNESFWMSPNFKAISYKIRDLKISISNSGQTAWWYCVLDDMNEWKGKPANWMDTRWTGVLEKSGDSWKIVQMHFSFDKK